MDPSQPVFYYDLGDPRCYILAETIMSTLPVVPEWEPVLGANLPTPVDLANQSDRLEIERLAAKYDLLPIRWPANWPPDTTTAMLAATYAKRIGRGVAFSLAAFRQAFAGGRDLGDEDTVLIAGAACEMHPTALRKGIDLAGTEAALAEANQRALAAGVSQLPAIQVGSRVFMGTDVITPASAALVNKPPQAALVNKPPQATLVNKPPPNTP
ncbi:MAG: DsbA family protein [Solirubrobacterales bacterium]|nr:DsbA family protein [Solirubrobacterales bacterium]